VALLCLISWALRLSALVKLISDSVLVGFKAGAGLTIAMTQLPSIFDLLGCAFHDQRRQDRRGAEETLGVILD
jgi:MFS superfamily sulfate permease-like transporter